MRNLDFVLATALVFQPVFPHQPRSVTPEVWSSEALALSPAWMHLKPSNNELRRLSAKQLYDQARTRTGRIRRWEDIADKPEMAVAIAMVCLDRLREVRRAEGEAYWKPLKILRFLISQKSTPLDSLASRLVSWIAQSNVAHAVLKNLTARHPKSRLLDRMWDVALFPQDRRRLAQLITVSQLETARRFASRIGSWWNNEAPGAGRVHNLIDWLLDGIPIDPDAIAFSPGEAEHLLRSDLAHAYPSPSTLPILSKAAVAAANSPRQMGRDDRKALYHETVGLTYAMMRQDEQVRDKLERAAVSYLSLVPSTLQPIRSVWTYDGIAFLMKHAPIFIELLRTGRFGGGPLELLSGTRHAFPYTTYSDDDVSPLRAAAAVHVPVGDIYFSPASESFRRHIGLIGDPANPTYAFTLKMPGDNPGRTTIWPNHFFGARILELLNPDRPSSFAPLGFVQLEGSVWMYGKRVVFTRDEPLGLSFAAFDDCRRMNLNAITTDMKILSLKNGGWTPAALSLLQLYYRGFRLGDEHTSDAHAGNVAYMLATKRLELVNDFGMLGRTPSRWAASADDFNGEAVRGAVHYMIWDPMGRLISPMRQQIAEAIPPLVRRFVIGEWARRPPDGDALQSLRRLTSFALTGIGLGPRLDDVIRGPGFRLDDLQKDARSLRRWIDEKRRSPAQTLVRSLNVVPTDKDLERVRHVLARAS